MVTIAKTLLLALVAGLALTVTATPAEAGKAWTKVTRTANVVKMRNTSGRVKRVRVVSVTTPLWVGGSTRYQQSTRKVRPGRVLTMRANPKPGWCVMRKAKGVTKIKTCKRPTPDPAPEPEPEPDPEPVDPTGSATYQEAANAVCGDPTYAEDRETITPGPNDRWLRGTTCIGKHVWTGYGSSYQTARFNVVEYGHSAGAYDANEDYCQDPDYTKAYLTAFGWTVVYTEDTTQGYESTKCAHNFAEWAEIRWPRAIIRSFTDADNN